MADGDLGGLVQVDLIGPQVLGGAAAVLTGIVFVIILAVLGVALFFLMRFLNYSTHIEIWENKANELVPFGETKARRVNKKGVTYISFLKYKDSRFKNNPWPESKYVYKNKLFGSKIKYIMDGDDLYPSTIELEEGKLRLHPMPFNERIDYIQKQDQVFQDHGRKSNTATVLMVAGAATFAMILFFGLFVIWQSNVDTAQATSALANAISNIAQADAQTIPVAPG